MDYPLVSIRIAAYNHEQYIEELLNSVLNDTYENKELIIINDGSTDNTPYIIEKWINNNKNSLDIKYRSRENKGLTATINELLSMCSGKFIVGIASDDVLSVDGIKKRIEYLISHPSKDAVFADCSVIDQNSTTLFKSGLCDLYNAKKHNFFSDAKLKREIINNWSVPGPVLMVRKSIYDDIGMYNEELIVEDWDLYLRMVAKNKLGFIDYEVAKYRLHGNNISFTNKANVLDDRINTAFSNYHLFKFPYNMYLLKEILYLYMLKIYRKIKLMLKER